MLPSMHILDTVFKLYIRILKQWNILTDDIKESKNLVIFKKKFKDMTLEKYRRISIDHAS